MVVLRRGRRGLHVLPGALLPGRCRLLSRRAGYILLKLPTPGRRLMGKLSDFGFLTVGGWYGTRGSNPELGEGWFQR